MNRFTPKQRAEIVTLYIENSRSVVLTQRAYRRKYRGQEPPSDNTIRRLVSNFVESPDLTPPDFFLWGYLKSKVYASKPQTIDELKANIRAEIIAIPPEMLEKVMENAAKRAHFALDNKGGHLIDVVFKN
ncbi:PREDICTED: uncharacterized protein LOC108576567 [Habropoda laboriosa]|uniref:uncharacterized protein LOC108576567 n=1 Tax=Habropoda laboriosa TaxID=597456 RepID=UPI00083D0645|nr:PREDICTED: uncharacterized protein LOC108576567 [Habropoda laboriosa]